MEGLDRMSSEILHHLKILESAASPPMAAVPGCLYTTVQTRKMEKPAAELRPE